MKPVYRVADVRAAEAQLIAALSPGELMQRASAGLTVECVRLLRDRRGKVAGAKVVLLVGSGDNGGDTLWAGANLAARGARVTAVLLGSTWHRESGDALAKAGGRLEQVSEADHIAAINSADMILDGIVGIGGKGALREPAAQLADAAASSAALVVAVDLPSGIDADTGAVADASAVVKADVTVTFGCLKPGLVTTPGANQAGELRLIDIGLGEVLSGEPDLCVMEPDDAKVYLARPGALDDKYTRGVVGVVAGSKAYPGAAVLCTGAARLGGGGMVRYAGGATENVIAHWPEVVITDEGPAFAGRVQSWVIGSGAGVDIAASDRLSDVLNARVPVLADADALTLIARGREFRDRIKARHDDGLVTALTPHAGEFDRLGFQLREGADADRVAAVRQAASQLGAVVLLKGSRTIVATPDGTTYVNVISPPELATAGSGDVLSGIAGSMLASAQAAAQAGGRPLSFADGAKVVASAAVLHGVAGEIAAAGGLPVTAEDILAALRSAVAAVRTGEMGGDDG